MSKAGRHWIISKTAICVFDQADAPYTTLIENKNEGGKIFEKKEEANGCYSKLPSINLIMKPLLMQFKKKKKKGWAEPEGLKAGRRARTCRLFPSLFWLSIINLFQKCRPEGMSSTCLFDDNMP